ncbi:MAG: FAD-dependent monooxygenase [Aestuariivirga sp.]
MKDYLIAGGGICGIASALGIAKAGKSARVFEQAETFEELGAGLQMSPNAVRALQYLGAWDALAPLCCAPNDIHIRDGISGRTLKRIALDGSFERRFGAPYRVAHRADLLRALIETARQSPRVTLESRKRVLAARGQTGDASLGFEGGQRDSGTAVIACDGIHSKLRLSIHPDSAPRDSGLILWRALIPTALAPNTIDPEAVCLWLRPGGHTVHYAVSGGRYISVVHVSQAHGSTARILPSFQILPDNLSAFLSLAENWQSWPGLDLEPLSDWTTPWGMILGDAAHATLHFLAQGAAMALEDACVLSKHVEAKAPLAGVAAIRRERTARVQLHSRRHGKIYHAGGPLRHARNLMMAALNEDRFIQRLSWLYEWRP